jgi:hypothetical protein
MDEELFEGVFEDGRGVSSKLLLDVVCLIGYYFLYTTFFVPLNLFPAFVNDAECGFSFETFFGFTLITISSFLLLFTL